MDELKKLKAKVDNLYEEYDRLFDLRDRGYSISKDEVNKTLEKYDYYLSLYKEMKQEYLIIKMAGVK